MLKGNKPYLIPFGLAIASFLTVFGFAARANNDIYVLGQLWKEGLAAWQDSISIEPGQEFNITHFTGNYSTEGVDVTSASLASDLPEYTSYQAGTAFQILDNSGNWQTLPDDGTTPFDGAGLSVTADGTLSALEFAQYKYTVTVDDYLPTGTTQLNWSGPVLSFTDASGPQTKGNMQATSITVSNVPAITSFSVDASSYTLGDVITATAQGDAGKAGRVEIGSISFNLAGAGSNYTGTYIVQKGDYVTATPRVFFGNGAGTGSYRDAGSSVAIDGRDLIPPDAPDSLVRPTTLNHTVVRFGPSNPLQFVWAPSLSDDVARYRVEVDDDAAFSSSIASLETEGIGTTLTATSSMITLPDGTYSWRVFAIDDAENISTPAIAPDNTFEIDTVNPDSAAYASPLGGSHIAGDFTASGTASDSGSHMAIGGSTTGIAKVEVFLQNFTANPVEYWNGSAWTTTQIWLTAQTSDNFTNWTYDFTAAITDGVSYFTGSRATDQAGNTLDSALISLTGNTTSPNVNITAPQSGSYQASAITVAGTASDPGGTVISDVSLSIQRDSDSQYWNGSAWIASQAWNTATTTNAFANWEYNFTPDFSAADGTIYTITAQATDSVFGTPNIGTSAAMSTIKDTTAPTIAITSPLAANSPYNAASWDVSDTITGTASDAGAGVSGVEVAIQDSNGDYWNGSAWAAPETWLAASSSSAFASWRYNNSGFDFLPGKDGEFTVHARGTDNAVIAPNTSAPISEIVVYDTTAPTVANALVTNATVSNITTLIKNGDTFTLSATITDFLQSGITTANISANIVGLTGNGAHGAVAPASYNTANGLAVWNFATAAGTGDGDVSVSISATDPAGNAAAFTDTAIIVADNTSPAVAAATLTAPSAAGIAWAGGSTQTITWNNTSITDANLAANPITLEYATSTTWNLIAANEANDGTFDWTVPSIDSNTVQVRITAGDQVANTSNDVSDNQFIIDSTPPTVPANTLTSPNGAEAWKQGTVQAITWNSAGITDNFGVAAGPIVLQYFTDTSGFINIASSIDNDGAFTWTTPIIDSTIVKVRILVYDAAGNTATDVSDAVFAIGLPPVIVEARAISDTLIEIKWDKPLASAGAFANYAATGITATAASLKPGDSTVVNLTVNSLGDTGFAASDLAVAAGTVMDTFNFTNETLAGQTIMDKQSPATDIANSYPNSSQLIVDYSPRIRIKISEAPDLGATVFKYDGGAQTPTYNALTGELEFNVAATLVPGQHSITLDLVDVAGNVEPTQTWNFWIDQLKVNMSVNPVSYTFNGNVFDESDASEQQTVSVETWGAGYAIFARLNPELEDGAGSSISDIDIKQSTQTWADKIDLNGTTLVSVVNVAKPATPYSAAQLDSYVFDISATIPGITQAAGNYSGIIEFIVVPLY